MLILISNNFEEKLKSIFESAAIVRIKSVFNLNIKLLKNKQIRNNVIRQLNCLFTKGLLL